MLDTAPQPPQKKRPHRILPQEYCGPWCLECQVYERTFPTAFLFGVLIFLLYYITIGAPIDFPSASFVKISPGESAGQVAGVLTQRHIIHAPYFFLGATRVFGKGQVVPGEYFFSGPETVLTIARRLSRGDYELIPVRVTIPEGVDSRQMGVLLTNKIPDFDTAAFLALAGPQEGYLFPDTYFFLPGESATSIIETMGTNFADQTMQIATTTAKFNKPFADIIIMASLLEKEAPDIKDRRIIAGILWHRIAIGMPLQVDAVFPYILGKNTFQLTIQDLAVASPYNTYIHAGLPPGPIANPGLSSILAAATPTKSNYLFYLSDSQGNFHFSVTYAQQLANERKYLR